MKQFSFFLSTLLHIKGKEKNKINCLLSEHKHTQSLVVYFGILVEARLVCNSTLTGVSAYKLP